MKLKLIAVVAAAAAALPLAGTTGAEASARVTNPWFPLKPGTTLVYRGMKDGKRARDVFTVTHRTKRILGATTTVVQDRLYLDGQLAEKTTDWYAQNRRGDVVYYGEATRAVDRHGKLTNTEGSWQAGVDGARAGIFMPARPNVGQEFQQEFYKGHAEDHFRVTGKSGPLLTTQEWTPLEPGVLDQKQYVRGVGTVSERALKGGDEHLELVSVKRGC
jgi:hypothetical protein